MKLLKVLFLFTVIMGPGLSHASVIKVEGPFTSQRGGVKTETFSIKLKFPAFDGLCWNGPQIVTREVQGKLVTTLSCLSTLASFQELTAKGYQNLESSLGSVSINFGPDLELSTRNRRVKATLKYQLVYSKHIFGVIGLSCINCRPEELQEELRNFNFPTLFLNGIIFSERGTTRERNTDPCGGGAFCAGSNGVQSSGTAVGGG